MGVTLNPKPYGLRIEDGLQIFLRLVALSRSTCSEARPGRDDAAKDAINSISLMLMHNLNDLRPKSLLDEPQVQQHTPMS